MEKSRDTYTLSREPREAERLEGQHVLYTSALGYLLNPDIELPKDAKIADVATGTAVWARALSDSLPASTEIHGFDISDSQFPPTLSQSNISLHIHNAKDSFPLEFHGMFDVVNVRLLVLGLAESDWPVVIQNLMQILKPGGRLQWVECDGLQGQSVLRDSTNAQREGLQQAIDNLLSIQAVRDQFDYPTRNLLRLFRDAGLGNVFVDIVSSDRDPHMRKETTRLAISGMISGRRGGVKTGKAYSDLEFQNLEELWVANMNSGAYFRYNIHAFLGTKAG